MVSGRRKVSTTVYLTVDQDERLSALSERTDVPVAAYIRRGVDWVLAKYEKRVKVERSDDDA